MQNRQSRERREEEDARIDWGIILSVMVLAIIGMLSIYVAASHDTSTMSVPRTLISQAMWYAIGIGAIIFIMQFDAEQLWKVAPIAYGLGITLLVLVLIFYSRALLNELGSKVEIIVGEKDPIVTTISPNIPVHIIAGAGHNPHVTHVEAVYDYLTPVLTKYISTTAQFSDV